MLVNLSEREIKALINTALEWCDSMQYERAYGLIFLEERLDNGLGSALCRLQERKARREALKNI